jgi:GH35 family endo-1,4-beta-xylanase
METTRNKRFSQHQLTRALNDFTEADILVAFAVEHGLEIRGHTSVWTNKLPEWLADVGYTQDELLDILHTHIADRSKPVPWAGTSSALISDANSQPKPAYDAMIKI